MTDLSNGQPVQYAEGGWLHTGSVHVVLHPDECFLLPEAIRNGSRQCGRPGHPTATSDCARTA